MKLLRTPKENFKNLSDYNFKPNYITVYDIKIHYLDEGPKSAQPILLMHGEPSWSYLYRHMIPHLVGAGYRCIVPDLIGFGKSDKPSKIKDHSYVNHVHWMKAWLEELKITNITLFCQDWGSLIGLRLVYFCPAKFDRVCLSNGGLPTGQVSMPIEFYKWREFSINSPVFDIGRIIQNGTVKKLSQEVLDAYNAPFPDEEYKAAARIFPSLVPVQEDDPDSMMNIKIWEFLHHWKKPFLTLFSDKDPITQNGEKYFQKIIPGAQNQNHTIIKGAGHFLQEEKGADLAHHLIHFIQNNEIQEKKINIITNT